MGDLLGGIQGHGVIIWMTHLQTPTFNWTVCGRVEGSILAILAVI